jgi:AcrR family transcriptional regulator
MKRAKPVPAEERRNTIIAAGLKLSIRIGYNIITRDEVARWAKISSPLISRYFDSMKHLRFAVMNAAIEREVVEVIAQGIILADPQTMKIPEATKQKVLSHFKTLL